MGLFTAMPFVARDLGVGEGSGKNIQKLSLMRCHQLRIEAGENLFLVSEISISLVQGETLGGKIAAKEFWVFFQHSTVTRRVGGITAWMQGDVGM